METITLDEIKDQLSKFYDVIVSVSTITIYHKYHCLYHASRYLPLDKDDFAASLVSALNRCILP